MNGLQGKKSGERNLSAQSNVMDPRIRQECRIEFARSLEMGHDKEKAGKVVWVMESLKAK